MTEDTEIKARLMAGEYVSMTRGVPRRMRLPKPIAFFVMLVGVLEMKGWKIIPPGGNPQ